MNKATLAALLLLAACSGQEAVADVNAMTVADRIAVEVDATTKTAEITEDNDPNDAIGRPGSYTQAASIYDSRVECEGGELDVTCGAKVEVFADADEAAERSDYIQGILEETPMLGAEYHYLDGAVLLRVTGDLKPSEAEEYEAAFN